LTATNAPIHPRHAVVDWPDAWHRLKVANLRPNTSMRAINAARNRAILWTRTAMNARTAMKQHARRVAKRGSMAVTHASALKMAEALRAPRSIA